MSSPLRPQPGSLRAVTTPLDPSHTAEHFRRAAETGILFAGTLRSYFGFGVAAVLDLPRGLDDPADLSAAQEWIHAVPHRDAGPPGPAAVTAFGAFPFDRSAPARLILPELTVAGDDHGRQWATTITPAGEAPGRVADYLPRDPAGPGDPAGQRDPGGPGARGRRDPVEVHTLVDGAAYQAAVAEAVRMIRRGGLQKVVLSRSIELRVPRSFRSADAVHRLHDQEPMSTVFSFPLATDPLATDPLATETGTAQRFAGASPELLVGRRDERVTSHPLAGTVALGPLDSGRSVLGGHRGAGESGMLPSAPRAVQDAIDRFLASPKEREEHRLVVDAIVAALGSYCVDLCVPEAPSLVRLATIAHMGTDVSGRLRRRSTDGGAGALPSVLELLAALHPTPAVGGLPRQEALECISSLEPTGRGMWAGPVGWVDARGDGDWVIGIRSGLIEGQSIRLTAGAGIVGGSDPAAELRETTAKLAPVLEAFLPGAASALVDGATS